MLTFLTAQSRASDRGIELWQKAVSAAVYTSFYVLLIAMPIVGYIANSAYGAPTPFFGVFELPPIVEKNEALSTPLFAIHRWVGWLLIIPGSDSRQRRALSPHPAPRHID